MFDRYITVCYISMTDPSFCEQRRLSQLFYIPPARFNLFSINPYLSGNYTKFQLDMRRKAEILKYSSARMSTQTNSLTKKQTYAGLVKGSIPSITTNRETCYDLVRPTPTSACGVPGPAMYLYTDPSVPLYNYATGNRAYGFNIPTSSYKWRAIEQPDAVLTPGSNMQVMQLQITNMIDQPNYKYAVSFPIGIDASASGIDDESLSYYSQGIIKITVYDIKLVVKYAGQQIGATYNSTIPETTVSIYIPYGNRFTLLQYIGNADFRDIELYTQSGYEYTMYMDAKIKATVDSPTIPEVQLSRNRIIANMSPTTANVYTDCILNSIEPSQTGNPGFAFTDV